MYPGESRIFLAILTGVAVLLLLMAVFIVTIIRYHRKKISFHAERMKAEINSIENERARIAKDLHDDMGASLSAIKLRLQCLEPENENNNLLVEQSELHIDEAMHKLRQISFDVMPQVLQRAGLEEALNELMEKLIPSHLIDVKFTYAVKEVDKEKRIHIYRIVQELLNNIIKHAKASVVDLALTATENKICLTIKDNGTGFDRNAILRRKKGEGLQNLMARAELLNAKVYLRTKPGQGVYYLIEIAN